MDEHWLRFGASLGIGLLIGLERERNPAARAGVRTFALIALAGTLAASLGGWLVPIGLAAVAAMLVMAYAQREAKEDAGTTTVAAALALALVANALFKLSVAFWHDAALARRLAFAFAAMLAGGALGSRSASARSGCAGRSARPRAAPRRAASRAR